MKIIGQKAKWLLGDGVAQIIFGEFNFKQITLSVNIFYRTYITDVFRFFRQLNNTFIYAISVNNGSSYKSMGIIRDNRFDRVSHIFNGALLNGSNNVKVYFDGNYPIINLNNIEYRGNKILEENFKDILFSEGDISDIKIGDFYAVPIVLTSDISAKYDSQGIARQKGECGLWNDSEKKFYANVNSEGAFSVSELLDEYVSIEEEFGIAFNGKFESIEDDYNKIFPILKGKKIKEIWFNRNLIWKLKPLIEGVNYQCYDWLKGDGYAWIDTKKIMPQIRLRLLINIIFHRQFSSKLTFMAITSRDPDWTGTNDSQRPIISLNPRNDEMRYYVDLTSTRTYVPFIYDKPISFDYSQQTYNKSKSSLNLFATQRLSFGNEPMVGDISKVVISGIDQDYYFSLHPCQLLTPILSQFASDKKPHPAGECGMIDKVTGIFYGNANTTGSFSVYND